MKKIFMLSFANIRKAKGNFISLLIMFLISSLLFNAGLLVLLNFGTFFDKTTEELNTSDTYYLISKNLYSEELEKYIFKHDNIVEAVKEENLWALCNTDIKGVNTAFSYLFNNADQTRELSKWKLVGESNPLTDMSIYMPISFKFNHGYKLNDEFNLVINDTTFNFKIAGFVEDIFFTTQETGLPGLYVNSRTYQEIEKTLGDDFKVIKIFANLKVNNKAIEIGIKEKTGAETLSAATPFTKGIFSLDLTIIKTARVMMATMISLIFVAFSAIIVIACLIVVRFRINNTIEDDMMKIGTLKAIGYTSKQIILSIILQFTLITFVGSIIGISTSFFTIPTLSNMFANQSALIWKQGFDANTSIFTLLFICIFVILVSLITSRRIHKLHPIVALRGGIVNHNFRKNHLPLSKSRIYLSFNLALKSIFNNLKQSLMILFIALAIAFAGSFSVIMFYNTNVDIQVFKETPGVETSNVGVFLDPNSDSLAYKDKITQLENVRKAQFIDTSTVFIEGLEIALFVMEDFNEKETNTIYEGRYPLHHNEIALNGYLAEKINKKIGDTIKVTYRENSDNYIITGFTQGAVMLGMNAFIRHDGMIKINPDLKQLTLQIYLTKGTDTVEFIKKLETEYKEDTIGIVNIDKDLEKGSKMYVNIVSQVGTSIMIITTVIIILVLYLVINSSIVRNKKYIGIQKSLGFTTFQLMKQISLLFVIPIIAGVLIGSILGTELTNPILSVLQKSMGIMKANYIITPLWIGLYGVLIIIISYLTSLFITYKIRKISAYSLITE